LYIGAAEAGLEIAQGLLFNWLNLYDPSAWLCSELNQTRLLVKMLP